MKKLIDLEENSLDMNEMSILNGGAADSGDTHGAVVKKPQSHCYSCDYVQPDGSGTIYYPDVAATANFATASVATTFSVSAS